MTTATDWRTRVGDVWAAEHVRTDRSLADLSRHLDAAILAAAPAAGNALDIGCGAGATTAALAAARPGLVMTGIDLSPPLLTIARARVPTARFRHADAAHDPLPGAPFDLFYSRHGVMFFADPVTAFGHLRAVAAPGAPLVFSCFRDRARNAFAGALVADVTGRAPAPDDDSPGPFAFASQDRVATILIAAGWTDATAAAIDFDYVAGQGDDPIGDAVSFLTRIGPVSRIIADAAPIDRSHLVARLTAALARYRTHDRVVLPASAWIWRAKAGEQA